MKKRKDTYFDPAPRIRRFLFRLYWYDRRKRELIVSRSLRGYLIVMFWLMSIILISRFVAIGFEFRTSATILGVPLLDIGREAKGVIAIGGNAQGMIAIGGVAVGVIAIGGVSIGLFSAGGLALGLILSIGGGAIGFYCLGGGAIGAHAFGDCTAGYYTSCGRAREILLGSVDR